VWLIDAHSCWQGRVAPKSKRFHICRYGNVKPHYPGVPHNRRSAVNQMKQGTKTSANMTLDADLLRQATALTPSLSETVERLLAAYIPGNERNQPQMTAQSMP
jgi:hypothetical protein